MKQVTQRLRDGRIEVLDVPSPSLTPEGVLVSVRASLLSAGTERSKVATARQGLIGKARSRPDQVRQVVDKARAEGLGPTLAAVRARLDQPSTLGYSAAGVVLAVGAHVRDLRPGDRVACGGGDYAVHAEVVHVPGNLCVRLPDSVPFDGGAFATVGAIALHGVRQADVRLGERAAVIGLGLVGQLAGMLLRAAGVTVVGIDLDEALCARACELGSVDVAHPRGQIGHDLPASATDVDATIITAATPSSDPVELAARMSRDRARVVIVGDVGLSIPRAPYYDKELDVRLSRSYGPGRYDREYEERGLDYPAGYVRWTERRNMQAFVDLVGAGRLPVAGLITERVPVRDAPQAYERLLDGGSPLGIVLEYPEAPAEVPSPAPVAPRVKPSTLGFGLVGAGSFAQRILVPSFTAAGFAPLLAGSQSGLSATAAVERLGFRAAAAPEEVLADPGAAAVAIATRHDSHARLAAAALRNGKAVFVEKPPALTQAELDELRSARDAAGAPLAVGFNRRHAPLVGEALAKLGTGAPREIRIQVSASTLPPDHWLNDPAEGGGRLVGEGCHFVDLACWLAGSLPEQVTCLLARDPGVPLAASQSFAITLAFGDGSLAVISYLTHGSPRLPKERVEVHAAGGSVVIDDFRALETWDRGGRKREKRRGQDKGHRQQLVRFRELVEGTAEAPWLDPLDSMDVTFKALAAAHEGKTL